MKVTTRSDGVEFADLDDLRKRHRVTLVSGGHRAVDGRALIGATVSGRAKLFLTGARVREVYWMRYELRSKTVRVADAVDGCIMHVPIADVVDVRFFDERRPPFHGDAFEALRRLYRSEGT